MVIGLNRSIRIRLLKGERKVEIWANSIGVSIVNIDYKNPDPFFNINTIEDLEKANEMISHDKL